MLEADRPEVAASGTAESSLALDAANDARLNGQSKVGGAAQPTFSGDDPVARGREAWERLKAVGRTSWEDWKTVGAALLAGRTHAMAKANKNEPRGERYKVEFRNWLQIHKFDSIDKSDRGRLIWIMQPENLDRIEKLRATWTDAQRASWNSPSKVWKVATCKDRGIAAMEKAEKAKQAETPMPNPSDLPPPTDQFDEENEELAWQRGLLLRIPKATDLLTLRGSWLLGEPPDRGLVAALDEHIKAVWQLRRYLRSLRKSTTDENKSQQPTLEDA